ncbi:2-amino-4-hydroxy-6-hydroxymethyldihydropteridine diphosphokinase [Herbaspirillum rhizosphaerae]|uniref:2-amino-4-hydroxy-6- hydroxymethyldihydropteridine diphosphokinase n=1 Tax=Herbaspirillum rhizosphaerae TaxID=346179 RepID=UPI00067AC93B|nr:2-amino-4-hydroxy-6-hydroxymethyldihydropteridine diphosphokinase [Herbaspirillum rhizosphaerae]
MILAGSVATPTTAYIGIGGNLGDARATVEDALRRLAQLPHTTLSAQSPLYRTAPVDAGGDDYVNAVAQLITALTPHDLLKALQEIEQAHGRERPYRNAPRTLDLDILLYGDRTIADDVLTVPHPRMTQRAFVLIPLLDIDPAVVIPGVGAAQDLRAAVADQAIQRLGG